MSTVTVISSEKTDIGKTIIAIKIAIELSKKGKKVLLADLSSGKRKISDYLKVSEDIIYDIKDVMTETCTIEQSAIQVCENLYVLPYPRVENKMKTIERKDFSQLIIKAKEEYDFVIAETGKLTSSFYIDYKNISNVILINNNDFSSINELQSNIDIASQSGTKKIIIMINKYNKKNASKGLELGIKDIKKMMQTDISEVIEIKDSYNNVDYDFLFTKESDSFNNAVENVVNNIYQK